jgi:uncharacterized coiled-coil DUF342 family protein
MKRVRGKEKRLITLLETVTGTTAPQINKFAVLLAELVRQRDAYHRERNAANAEVIRWRRRARRADQHVVRLQRDLRDAQTIRGNLSTRSEDIGR